MLKKLSTGCIRGAEQIEPLVEKEEAYQRAETHKPQCCPTRASIWEV